MLVTDLFGEEMKKQCYECESEFDFTKKDVKVKNVIEECKNYEYGWKYPEFFTGKNRVTYVKCKACGEENRLKVELLERIR